MNAYTRHKKKLKLYNVSLNDNLITDVMMHKYTFSILQSSNIVVFNTKIYCTYLLERYSHIFH